MKIFRLYTHLPKRTLLVAAGVLVAVSFFTAWFFQSKPSVEQQQKLLQRYINEQLSDAAELLKDTALLHKMVLHKESPQEFEKLQEKKYGLFLFAGTTSDNQNWLYWNNQQMIPPPADFSLPEGIYFYPLRNGYYIIRKTRLDLQGVSDNMIGYVLVPVLYRYFLETPASQTGFAHSHDAVKKINLSQQPTEFPIYSSDGQILFYVTKAGAVGKPYAEPVTLILRLLALTLLLVYLHLVIETINRKRGGLVAVALLAASLIIIRMVFYSYPEIFSLRNLGLFNPTIYASNLVNRSLGDLLINALFLCWIVLYAWNTLGPIKRLPRFLKDKGIVVAGVAGIFILIFTTFQLANIVHQLVVNSKISFDVTNFFSLSMYTVFSIINGSVN